MKRKLLLTPFEHGSFYAIHQSLNNVLKIEGNADVDIQHILFSSVIMCGVDEIQSIGRPLNTRTTLVTKLLPDKAIGQYFDCVKKVELTFKNYGIGNGSDADFSIYAIALLIYCMQINSAAFFSGDLSKDLQIRHLPSELSVPIQILISSIEYKNANLPVIRGDIEKKNIQRLMDVYQSQSFANYKEAQGEVENGIKLTNTTINKIEKAGKELMRNNGRMLMLKDSIINAVPVTAKLIELFFGKLPGIISKYATDIAEDYLKSYKSIPIYNCGTLISTEREKRLLQFIMDKMKKDGISQNDNLEVYLDRIFLELRSQGESLLNTMPPELPLS